MKPVHLTKASFKQEISETEKLVLVDFWAEWCSPCRMVAPVLQEIASEYTDVVKVTKLNVDTYPEIAQAFGIRSIPTILFFQKEKIVHRIVGFLPKEELKSIIDGMLQPVSSPLPQPV